MPMTDEDRTGMFALVAQAVINIDTGLTTIDACSPIHRALTQLCEELSHFHDGDAPCPCCGRPAPRKTKKKGQAYGLEIREVAGYSPPWAVLSAAGIVGLYWTRKEARDGRRSAVSRLEHGEHLVEGERGWAGFEKDEA